MDHRALSAQNVTCLAHVQDSAVYQYLSRSLRMLNPRITDIGMFLVCQQPIKTLYEMHDLQARSHDQKIQL